MISMKNRITRQLTRNIRHIFVYLLSTYGKISPSHLNDFEKEATDMRYGPVNPVDKISNKIEDLLEYRYMENCPYSHTQEISKAYSILNKTGKYRESIKS